MAVGVRKIGLDIINGGLVCKVGARNVENGAILRLQVYPYKIYAGKPDRIRAERRARCENAHARFTAELRGCDGGRKFPVFNAIEVPDEPEVAPAVDAAQEIRVPVGWLEDDFGNQGAGQTGLARDAEFGGEI